MHSFSFFMISDFFCYFTNNSYDFFMLFGVYNFTNSPFNFTSKISRIISFYYISVWQISRLFFDIWNCWFSNNFNPVTFFNKARYFPGKTFKSRWIWMGGYGENPNWIWHTVYLQGVSGRSFCTWSKPCISITIPSVNERPSWSYMENIANYSKFNHGSRTGFWLI